MAGSLLFERVSVEPKLNYVLEVEANGLDIEVQDVEGVVHEKGHTHQEHAHKEANLGETTNSDTDTRDGRYCCHRRDTPDNDHLGQKGINGVTAFFYFMLHYSYCIIYHWLECSNFVRAISYWSARNTLCNWCSWSKNCQFHTHNKMTK